MILLRSVIKLRAAVMSSCVRSQFSLPSALTPKERLIWVDCEMTGLNIETDKLLEIAVIVTEGDTLATVGGGIFTMLQREYFPLLRSDREHHDPL